MPLTFPLFHRYFGLGVGSSTLSVQPHPAHFPGAWLAHTGFRSLHRQCWSWEAVLTSFSWPVLYTTHTLGRSSDRWTGRVQCDACPLLLAIESPLVPLEIPGFVHRQCPALSWYVPQKREMGAVFHLVHPPQGTSKCHFQVCLQMVQTHFSSTSLSSQGLWLSLHTAGTIFSIGGCNAY